LSRHAISPLFQITPAIALSFRFDIDAISLISHYYASWLSLPFLRRCISRRQISPPALFRHSFRHYQPILITFISPSSA
jgi:hypothetical protein